ncbi:DoxX family protein [Streptomyces smaragdinus]|nr:DoxX family protein [Streptomyces smaragdinus]
MTLASVQPGIPVSTAPTVRDVGLLLLRLCICVIMTTHGTQKLFGWFGGPGLTATGRFFEGVGYPSGRVMGLVAGLCETLGGLGLGLGLLTPLAGAAVLGTMLNALSVHWTGGLFASNQGFEYELMLAGTAAALILTGPGSLAADRLLPVLGDDRRGGVRVAALLLAVAAAGLVLLIRD